MSTRGAGGFVSPGSRAREGPSVRRDGSGGSRKGKKEMPGGLRLLHHVIRPGPARAPRWALTSLPRRLVELPRVRRAPLVHLPPPRRPGWSCGCVSVPRRVRSAPAQGCSAWPPAQPLAVMPHEHHRVTFRSLATGKACAFLTPCFSGSEFPLCVPLSSISAIIS